MTKQQQMDVPECFGKGWDEISIPDCQGCSGKHKCKDAFIHGPLHEALSQNPGITEEQLSQLFSITLPSIQSLMQGYNEIMGAGQSAVPLAQQTQPPVPPAPPIQQPQVVQHQAMQIPQAAVPIQNEKPIPAKKRKGKRPADLIQCPYCGGTGWQGELICNVCGGTGDISAKKLAEYQAGGQPKSAQPTTTQSPQMAAGAPQVSYNRMPTTGNVPMPPMAGGGAPSIGSTGVLPVQGAQVSNVVQPSAANSGGVSETKTGRKAGNKGSTKLERDSFLSLDSVLSLSNGQVKSVFLDNENGEIRVVVGLA